MRPNEVMLRIERTLIQRAEGALMKYREMKNSKLSPLGGT
jgi:hypothetical protein